MSPAGAPAGRAVRCPGRSAHMSAVLWAADMPEIVEMLAAFITTMAELTGVSVVGMPVPVENVNIRAIEKRVVIRLRINGSWAVNRSITHTRAHVPSRASAAKDECGPSESK